MCYTHENARWLSTRCGVERRLERHAAEPVVQSDLRGMNAAEAVVEAKRPAGDRIPRGSDGRSASLKAAVVAQRDEHVLGLDGPALEQWPFNSAAECPGGDGVGT